MVARASTVDAKSIAPGVYSAVPKESLADGSAEDVLFDIRNLLVMDPHPLPPQLSEKHLEAHLLSSAQRNTQLLINELFKLPQESSTEGPVAKLPAVETSSLPREKPIPKPKAETKWERFAKEKGITGRKRSRKVWDEEQGEWKPLWGYQRAGQGAESYGIVELKEGDGDDHDPWSKARGEKRSRVAKNETARMKNKERAAGKGGRKGDASNILSGIPVDMAGGKRGKANTSAALARAQVSTASLGKFDAKRSGEVAKPQKGGKRAFKPLTTPAESEAVTNASILRRVVAAKGKSKAAGKGAVAATAAKGRGELAMYDAIHGNDEDSRRKRKGKAAAGKFKKATKSRAR
jgi:regulator of ribosome biosynthesis